MSCIVFGCPNGNDINPSVQYHIFPKQPTIVQQWIQASGVEADQIDVNTAKICSIHFNEHSYTDRSSSNGLNKILKHDAIPTLHLPTEIIINHENNKQTVATSNNAKYERVKTYLQLSNLIKENKRLQEKICTLENRLKVDKTLLDNKRVLSKQLDLKLTKIRQIHCTVQRSVLSIQKQKQLLSKVFSEQQIKLLSGKKRVAWTDDDMAVGFTIRHLSNRRCYLHLTKNLNIPLPGVSSIKRWMRAKRDRKRQQIIANNNNDDNE